MGRPVNSRYFGNTKEHTIILSAWTSHDVAPAAGYIKKQDSDDQFVATTAAGTSLCLLVNGAPTGPGQASLEVFPVIASGSGAAGNANLKVVSATLSASGAEYEAGDVLTLAGGTKTTAATITVGTVNANGAILTYTLGNVADQAYTALPKLVADSVTGGEGTGATFNLSFGIESINLTSGGINYPSVEVEISQSGSTVDPIVTATTAANVVTSTTVVESGAGFTSIPSVNFVSTSTTEYVKRLSNNRVITWQGNVYDWFPSNVTPLPGQANLHTT